MLHPRLAALIALAPTAAAQVPAQRVALDVAPYVLQLGTQHAPADASGADGLQRVAALPDGGAVLAGTTMAGLVEPLAGSGTDLVVTRLFPDGSVRWIRQLGSLTAATIPAANGDASGPGGDSTGWELAGGVVVCPDGTIVVAGSTGSSLGETSAGAWDGFVAKLDGDGQLLWVRQLGVETAATIAPEPGATQWGDASGSEQLDSVVVRPDGRIVAAGWTTGSLSQDSAGKAVPLLVELDPQGQVLWLRQIGAQQMSALGFGPPLGGHSDLYGLHLALDPSGELVVAGTSDYFVDRFHFQDVFVLRYAADGRPLAIRWPFAWGAEAAGGLAIDPFTSRIFVAGHTSGSVAEANAGAHDALVTCLDASLATVWTRQLGATTATALGLLDASGHEYLNGVCLDGAGGVVLGGSTGGSLDQPNAGGSDPFTWRLRADDGEPVRVTQLGQTTATALGLDLSGEDGIAGLALGPAGSILLCGQTSGDLGDLHAGGNDALVLRLDASGDL